MEQVLHWLFPVNKKKPTDQQKQCLPCYIVFHLRYKLTESLKADISQQEKHDKTIEARSQLERKEWLQHSKFHRSGYLGFWKPKCLLISFHSSLCIQCIFIFRRNKHRKYSRIPIKISYYWTVIILEKSARLIFTWTWVWLPAVMLDKNQTASY